MATPVDHVRALREEHLAEGRMAVVGRTGEHHVFAVDLTREQNAVPVIGQVSVRQAVKCLEIIGIRHTDGRSVVLLKRSAPCHIIAVLEEADARVVTGCSADALAGLLAVQLERFMLDLPVKRIHALSEEQLLLHGLVIAAEHPDKCTVLRDYRAVKNTVRRRNIMSSDDRVVVISPDNVRTSGRTILPRDVRKVISKNHNEPPFFACSL